MPALDLNFAKGTSASSYGNLLVWVFSNSVSVAREKNNISRIFSYIGVLHCLLRTHTSRQYQKYWLPILSEQRLLGRICLPLTTEITGKGICKNCRSLITKHFESKQRALPTANPDALSQNTLAHRVVTFCSYCLLGDGLRLPWSCALVKVDCC